MSDLAEKLRGWQDEVTAALERAEPKARFREDLWDRPGGGGGRTRVLEGGELFERAGVNFSDVHGELPEPLADSLPGSGRRFRATGVSIVIHPLSPMVPATHANYRFLERGETCWFGGGADLTPYYLYEEDARHFHRTLKAACDRHDPALYPRFKRACDEYFFLKHRGEARGVGGIFFDYLQGERAGLERLVADLWGAFLPAYLPIVERRRGEPWGEAERHFQLVRRGRYVEFNLVQDRGTLFGLQTQGRIESILMSLPSLVRWEYSHEPPAASREARLMEVLRRPRDWAEESP
jgi:coproporphyrinogen III oxidase